MKKILLLFVVVLTAQAGYGQFRILKNATNRIADKTAKKLEKKIEDKVVEVVSDEITRRAFKSIDNAVDDMMKERYQDSVGHEVNWEEAGKAYGDFLKGMNSSVGEIPEQYSFDITNTMEVVDAKGNKNFMKMMFSNEGKAMGFETNSDKNKKERSVVIFDLENDAFVMLNTDKKGNKSGQVMPSLLNLASAVSKSTIESEVGNYEVSKIGKGPKYLGYSTTKYEIDSKDHVTEAHVANDFPLEWQESYRAFADKFAPSASNFEEGMPPGITMYTKTKEKKKKPKSTTSTIVDVDQSAVVFKKADYNFPSM